MVTLKKLEYKVFDPVSVSCGDMIQEVRYAHGVTPKEFIEAYEYLSVNYQLSITKQFIGRFLKEISTQGKREKVFKYNAHLFDFILDAYCLTQKGINIQPLTREFNNSGDSKELIHACNIAALSAVYALKGYSIHFPSKSKSVKSPDMIVSGISSDVKTIMPTNIKSIHQQRGQQFDTKLGKDLCYDIGKSISSRLYDGIQQADIVFIYLGAKSLGILQAIGTLNLNEAYMPEPRPCRVIFYSLIRPTSYRDVRDAGLPYYFYATHMDVDQTLWNAIRHQKLKITHLDRPSPFLHMKPTLIIRRGS